MSLYTIRNPDGVQIGPMSLEQLEHLIKQARVKPATMIFTQGINRWHLAAAVPEIRTLLLKYQPGGLTSIQRINPDAGHPRESAMMRKSGSGVSSPQRSRTIRPSARVTSSGPLPSSSSGAELYTIRASDGVVYGPANVDQVKELVKQGKIKATTMIFMQSTGRWHLAASIQEVRAFLRKFNPTQDSILNRIRAMGAGNIRDSAHALTGTGRMSSIRVRHPFWKRLFSR
jgi:hypothetical protein